MNSGVIHVATGGTKETVQYRHHPCLERELKLTKSGVSEIAMVETKETVHYSHHSREKERGRELKGRSQ